jgi:undecaprenyl-diphosphatase
MSVWAAIVLGLVEGLTEFLPVSSTGHLTIVEALIGLPVDDPAVTGFTAVIQVGAIAAAILYFLGDIVRLAKGLLGGLVDAKRRAHDDWRIAWCVLLGSLPIGVVGLLCRDFVKGPLRNLWVVAAALVAWSVVMVLAERVARQRRGEHELTIADGVFVGFAQCIALVPGVSRSGATISAGLFRDLDRIAATRLSFLLGIPALTAAGLLELKDALSGSVVGVLPLAVGTVVSFVVAYAAIAWLLRFLAGHSLGWFAGYRIAAGLALMGALALKLLPAR